MLIGTPAYMSPEQCMGRSDLDHRTDLYSLGCILFHVLCGRPPFLSEHGTGMMIAAHMRDPAPDPRTLAPHVPAPLVAITLRLLEKDPAARFQTAQELRDALVAAGAIAPSTRPDDAYNATLAATPASVHRGRDAYAATAAPTGGRDGYAATAALTTGSGSAAELMTKREGPPGAPPAARPQRSSAGSKRGAWIAVGGLLLVLAGVGVAVAVSSGGGGGGGGGGSSAGGGGSGSEPMPAGQPVVEQPAPDPEPVKPQPSPPPELVVACPVGQLRSDDTQGHCCWPGQAWSTPKDRCIGAPSCPPGTRASREQCVATADTDPVRRPPPPDGRVVDPALRLGAASYAPGAAIEIQLAAPISAPIGHRAWVTVSEAGSPRTSYGAWTYVDDGARLVTLKAPAKPGAYEVRLHTDYPAKSYNVVRSVGFAVAPAAEAPEPPPDTTSPNVTPRSGQRFTLASTTLPPGARAELRFPSPLRALPNEQFWVTVVERGAADSKWGKYAYVPPGARAMTLEVPSAPGDYELRLHANYPTKTTNLVYRVPIRVE